MPPKGSNKQYITFLVNIGTTGNDCDSSNRSFLDKAKELMKLMTERKIFLHPSDEIGIIVMGALETNNELLFDNINVMNPMELSSWKLVEDIERLQATDISVDWVHGLQVALGYMNKECIGVAKRLLVVLTNFKEDEEIMEQYDIQDIIDDVKQQQVFDLLAIGDLTVSEESKKQMNFSEKLFVELCEQIDGQVMTFEDTLPKLRFFKETVKAMPWPVDMNLFVTDIPVTLYLRVTETSKIAPWKLVTTVDEREERVMRTHVKVDKTATIISEQNIINGYKFGRKFVPFSEADVQAMKYESGPKGFTIFGFAKRNTITLDCLAGKGSYVVVPGQDWAASLFYSLVQAMENTNTVAIVRRIYRLNLAPKMGVLIPYLNVPGQPWCLVYIELTFAEDRRIVQVKPLKATMNQLSSDEEDAINNLIDSMMLTGDQNDENEPFEEFKVGTVPNPGRQHVWNVLAHRALHPDKPIPPMEDYVAKILEPPEYLISKRDSALETVTKLFPVERVLPKDKSKEKVAEQSRDSDDMKKVEVEVSVKENPLNNQNSEKLAPEIKDSPEMDTGMEDLLMDI